MNPTPKDPARTITPEGEPDQDARAIVQILDEYLARLESGEPMDRQQLLAAHPELADQLSARLDALDFMYGVAPQLADDAPRNTEWPTHVPSKCLGDFRLLREIGRGGMGVVYEAEQESLGRRVALKVLPFAALMDSRQLQRFKNEARAAATLHHANIVPVYSVGFERGIHYFAMQLIEGSSLETILRQLRQAKAEITTDTTNATQPTEQNDAQSGTSVDTVPINALTTAYSQDRNSYFRHAARIAIDAAEALDHAHSLGIVHRDVKPANLLLDFDGRLWVTDFGLARLETDAGMTMSGDVMGTLRYMSSEQAQGKRHLIDPRSDIYSLGATLYELLTLQPVFPVQDRPQLMRQITEQEPRLLRSIDGSIPPDLETIVLKTLQKSPDDRYASAQDLADDLRRFLDEKSIEAKRPTRIARAIRWSRRHIETLSAVAIALIITLIIATALVTSAYRGEMRQRVIAEKQRVIAEKQRKRAEEHLQLARTVVDTMYTRFADEWLRNDITMTDVQKEYLQRAAEFYDQLSDQEATDPAIQLSMADAKTRLGRLYNWMRDNKLANAKLKEALAILQQIPSPLAESPKCRYVLAWCHFELQESISDGNHSHQNRLAHLRDARQIITGVLQKDASDDPARLLLIAVADRMGSVHMDRGEFEESKRVLIEARQAAEQIDDEATRYQGILGVSSRLGALPSAYLADEEKDEVLRRGVEASRALHAKAPRNPIHMSNLANALNNLASFRFDHLGASAEEALPLFEESATILVEIVDQVPEMFDAAQFLTRVCGNMNYTASKSGADAKMWRRVIGGLERIFGSCVDDAQRAVVLGELADSYSRLVRALESEGDVEEALKVAQNCHDLIKKREQLVPQGNWPSLSVALASGNLCQLFVDQERPADAYRHGLETARHAQRLILDAPADGSEDGRRHWLKKPAYTIVQIGARLSGWGPESILKACQEAVDRQEYEEDDLWLLRALAHAQLGNHQQVLDRVAPILEQEGPLPPEMLMWAFAQMAEWTFFGEDSQDRQREVCQLVEKLIQRREARFGPNGWRSHHLGGATHSSLAESYHTLTDWPLVIHHGQLAIQHDEACVEAGVLKVIDTDLREQIARTRLTCASAYWQQGDYGAAAEMATQSIERYRAYLKDVPRDTGARKELADALLKLSEINYFADRSEEARRSYDESLQVVRELIADGTPDSKVPDHRKLCGMLTRSPFSLPNVTEEAKQIAVRMLEFAPDDPAVWYEAAWVEYRRGDHGAARDGFERYLTWAESADKQQHATAAERQRMALAGIAVTLLELGDEDAARDYFHQAVAAFEQVPNQTVFSMQEHCVLREAAEKLNQEDLADRIFADQFADREVVAE